MVVMAGRRMRLRPRRSDFLTLVHLLRSGVAPTVALCFLLNEDIAEFLGPVGYVAGILAITPVLPQAQHLELIFQRLLALCLVTAFALFELFCVVEARKHTSAATPPPPPTSPTGPVPVPYSASASAVAGVWLLFLIFVVSWVRSVKPHLTMACIDFAVVTVVTTSIAPTIPNMTAATTFAAKILTVNLIGVAVSFVTGLLPWWDTNRAAFERSAQALIVATERCLPCTAEPLDASLYVNNQPDGPILSKERSCPVDQAVQNDGAASATALIMAYNRMRNHSTYMNCELGVGRLTPGDLSHVHSLLLEVVKPVIGLMASIDRLRSLPPNRDTLQYREHLVSVNSDRKRTELVLLYTLRSGAKALSWAGHHDTSLHSGAEAAPSDRPLADLKQDLQDIQFNSKLSGGWSQASRTSPGSELEHMLFLVGLQAQELTLAACSAAMDFAEFANQKSENRRRLIFPRLPSARGPGVEPVARRLFGWVISGRETWSTSPAHSTAGPKQGHKSLSRYIYMLRSHHATFAFRIACAVLCSQLPACLRQTQAWYNAQRVVWTSITVAVATHRKLGQSVFSVACQTAGTLAGCLLSLMAWYIVNGNIPGVTVFYLLCMMLAALPGYNRPELFSLSLIAEVTLTLLVGYELDSHTLGRAAVAAMGQPYYPPYLLAWMNMLTILAGIGIAFFWTVFPYPMLESDEMPAQFGEAMYTLAELQARSYRMITHRINGLADAQDADTTGQRSFSSTEARMIDRLVSLRTSLQSSKYQIAIGNHYPRDIYANLLDKCDGLFRSISLLNCASRGFKTLQAQQSPSIWLQQLRRFAAAHLEIQLKLTALLMTCATATSRSEPLPPSLDMLEAASLVNGVDGSLVELLDARNIEEPGFAALGMLHTSALLVVEDVRAVVECTKQLVGQVDIGP